MLLDGYLKEDYHYTAYSSNSYLEPTAKGSRLASTFTYQIEFPNNELRQWIAKRARNQRNKHEDVEDHWESEDEEPTFKKGKIETIDLT